MAKSMIGLDPLAWLTDDSGTAVKKKPSRKKSKSKKKVAVKKKVTAKNKIKEKALVGNKSVENKPVGNKPVTRKKTASKNKAAENTGANAKKEISDNNEVETKGEEAAINEEVMVATTTETEPEENAVSNSTVTLNDVQDISMVTDLHKQVAALINTQDIVFDGSTVEKIDSASLQLIACAFKQAEKYDNNVSWQGASDALKKSASLLGLTETLNLQH